jgi:hypothetical protein
VHDRQLSVGAHAEQALTGGLGHVEAADQQHAALGRVGHGREPRLDVVAQGAEQRSIARLRRPGGEERLVLLWPEREALDHARPSARERSRAGAGS